MAAASTATSGDDTEVTVTFDEIDEGTRVVLIHFGLKDGTVAKRHEGGWQSILMKCRELLAA